MIIFLIVILLLLLMFFIVKVRYQEWIFIDSFYFMFIMLSMIGFGDFLLQFNKDVDYIFVFLVFVGFVFVFSIFCLMNIVFEQYGVSVCVVQFLCEKCKDEEMFIVDEGVDLDKKDKFLCDLNGVKDGVVMGNDKYVF